MNILKRITGYFEERAKAKNEVSMNALAETIMETGGVLQGHQHNSVAEVRATLDAIQQALNNCPKKPEAGPA